MSDLFVLRNPEKTRRMEQASENQKKPAVIEAARASYQKENGQSHQPKTRERGGVE